MQTKPHKSKGGVGIFETRAMKTQEPEKRRTAKYNKTTRVEVRLEPNMNRKTNVKLLFSMLFLIFNNRNSMDND